MSKNIMDLVTPPDETEVPGMKILYADKSEAYRVTYVKDVVYDVRSGIPLHLQMLYPVVPAPLADKIAAEQQAENDAAQARQLAAEGYAVDQAAQEKKHQEENEKYGNANAYQSTLRMPCVVFVQGSAWGKQNCYGTLPLLVDIARQGFVVASVEYRSAYEEHFPGFVSDVKAAIRFLKANSAFYGIDPTRIAVWGHSSGGHTALMVGATGWTKEFDDGIYPEEDSSVCACIAYYGVAEFSPFVEGAKYARPILFDVLLGKEEAKKPENVAKVSPVTYIKEDQKYPPFLLMHGDMDAIVPFEQSVFMYNKLRECGKRVDFYKVRGANHNNYFWTPEVLDITAQFLKAYV